MTTTNELRDRYSVCLVHVDPYTEYHKYFRIADFDPARDKFELAPALVQADSLSLEDAVENPDTLYNPNARYNYDSRKSDFYLFRWKLDPSDFSKQITTSFYDDETLEDFGEPREVFVLHDCKTETDLRRALAKGIPFEGITTSVFYIVYECFGEKLTAVQCDKSDFDFSNEKIKLAVDVANPRSTVLSAPKVELSECDIIESRFPEKTGPRMIYSRLDDLDSCGRVLLRNLDYFASDYVKWYIRECGVEAEVSRSDRQDLVRIINTALLRPDAIEEYLGADVPNEELASLQWAISQSVADEEDQAKELIRKAILKDDAFRQSCLAQVLEEGDAALTAKQEEINQASERAESLNKDVDSLTSQIDELKAKKTEAESGIAALDQELSKARAAQDTVLSELESNVALKLGLRAVASSVQSQEGTTSGKLLVSAGALVNCETVDASLADSLASNLKELGAISVASDSSKERERAAVSIASALSVTNVLAMPSAIAEVAADAICYSLAGRSASRIWVPADYRDAESLINQINTTDAEVVFLDNVVDSVNEGILNALLHIGTSKKLVLSFLSHDSARLVAREAWGSMFFPSVEGLSVLVPSKCPKKLGKSNDASSLPKPSTEDTLDSARYLQGGLDGLSVPNACALLVAAVMQAAESFTENDVEPYVSQHIAISCVDNVENIAELKEWAGEDQGLTCLAQVIGFDER